MTRLAGRRALPATALSALTLALVAACSSSGSNAAPAGSAGSSAAAPAGQQAPVASGVSNQESAALTALYKGTLQPPSSASRPAVKGKKIVIISAGQSSISSSIPVNATEQAAKAIGWQVSVYDEQLNPANAPGLMRQAISSGADGIIMDATDCPTIKGPLQEAKAKGIPVLGIYSFDCNDPAFGGGGQPLFSGYINYGIKGKTLAQLTLAADKFTESYGAAQADAMIAATNGHAKIIYFNDPEFVVLHYTGEGFLNEIKNKCPGCSVVDKVSFTGTELGSVLQQKASAALLQHPEANAIKSPYTAASILGISAAVSQSGRAGSMYVMGGEGFQPELDLLRAHQGISAVMIAPSDWTGWAAVDTMNSLFLHKAPAFSGLGWELVDATHNLPATGPFLGSIDYKAIYEKAWGVGP
jgi:ribose transport system substrate-binding protein